MRGATADPTCPFCPGNESLTPAQVAVYMPAEGAAAARMPVDGDSRRNDWGVRVVPNLYPALDLELAPTPLDGQFYQRVPAIGRHEVVIESRRHVESFADLTLDEAAQTFIAYRDRFRVWRSDGSVVYPLAFKNCRQAAGSSLVHVHSQLVGMPSLPTQFVTELRGAERYFTDHKQCGFCEMTKSELNIGQRIIQVDDQFVVFCPFASRAPYEMWIVPRRHACSYTDAGPETVTAAGRLVHDCLTRLERVLRNVPYNYLIHTAPFDRSVDHYYHWHIEIIPRITKLAGFEWATGCAINSVEPEQAAARLRAA